MTSGTLEKFPLPQYLRELARARRTGVLAVRSGKWSGRICLELGHVADASLDGHDEFSSLAAFQEMLQWHSGTFDMFYLQWQTPERLRIKPLEMLELKAA